ncbi:MAG: 3-hydroxybutyryl-CoA dehydrogenase [Acidobacteria bacterium]|nr:3-hydroxybutyryl-CoA dehydrogenase [Acidobacteriota bacterium]MBI3830988.1 3-hydroxybutyryl-CoA dehydrogenase [Planctomycetota bacterium]
MPCLEKVAVIGAGTMGAGIAQVAASSGVQTILIDTGKAQLEKARNTIETSLQRMASKGTLTQAQGMETAKRISFTIDITDAEESDLVVEAVFEREDIKREIWEKLDALCKPDALFASNTSSISITQLAAISKRPELFIGMHFFNPVPVMKLVEVIRGNKTSDATAAKIMQLAQELGKTPVEVKDFPGFVSNRVLMPLLNEAMFAVYEGVASPEAVDHVFKLGMAHPMGPLTLADFIGLDVCLNIMEVLQDGFGDPKYRPCPLLKQMVAAGKLGRKSGEGFYKYQG